MKVFIVDKLDFWTLQFYRRLYCREPELHLVSIDPNWEKHLPRDASRAILPHHWIKRIKVVLDKPKIQRQKQSYETTWALPGEFAAKPYSKYLVSFQYFATGSDVTLSCNFFGDNRDFKQQHIEIKELGVWRRASLVLETEFFRSEENVKLRFWPILSAPKTSIRIEDVTVSMEPSLTLELKKHVEAAEESLVFWADEESQDAAHSVGGTIITVTDLYCCKIPEKDVSFETSCYQANKSHVNNFLCSILDSQHDGKLRDYMVDDNKLLSKDRAVVVPVDDSLILLPCSADFYFQGTEGFTFVGSEAVLEQIKNSAVGLSQKTAKYHTLDQWESVRSEAAVIADSLDDSRILRLILKCWSRGQYVISLVPLPANLQGSPIHRAYLNDVPSFMNLTLDRLHWLRETGYLIARNRDKSKIREDLIRYLEWHD